MGKNSDGNANTNALDLHLNLAGQTQVEMTFWIYDHDDNTDTQDGIYFSSDNGNSFAKVYDFTPSAWANAYRQIILDVDQLSSERGLNLNNQFIIRFQQYGSRNFSPSGCCDGADGFIIDDVEIKIPLSPYITDFAPGFGPIGALVTVQGKNFQSQGEVSVKFNNTSVVAADITVVSDEILIAKVPTGATTGKISITNPKGTGGSEGNFIVTSETVLAPTSLTATAGNAVVNLAWQNPATNDIEIVVERATTTPTNFQVLVSLPNTAVSYVDNTVTNGTQYHYRVRAFSILGSSPYSNTANATPSGVVAPTAPSGLIVTAPTTSTTPRLELSWTDNSNNEDGFEIWRGLTAGGTFTKIITVPANTTSYTDITGLNAATQYCYKVRAFNTGGGNETAAQCATTQSTLQLPNAPSNLTAVAPSNANDTQINLSWSDNSNNETGFKVLRASSANGVFELITTLAANTTSFSNIGLAFGTPYFYKVLAFNDAGDSQASNTANATSQDKVTAIEDDALKAGTKIFPNPSTGVFKVKVTVNNLIGLQYQISDMQGKAITQSNFIQVSDGYEVEIDLKNQANATYLLKISTADGRFLTKRLVKE
ncbi:MAG: T9SS type A sorting domain-containing protein [Microscillaceae bacterium]|nr:T9SS type A sorting domain-containing protein [Microscillaceae bacterium]